MNKEDFKKAVGLVRKDSGKRKFSQSFDLIINLRDLDLKKPEEQVEVWVPLPNIGTLQKKVCALVGAELAEQAKKVCDGVVVNDDFKMYAAEKKKIKKLAKGYDYFVAQANIMQEIAKTFGRVFGPRGKMPNPKAGCVVPPNANLAVLVERLKTMVKLSAKVQPSVKTVVGTEEMSDEQILDNIVNVYSAVVHQLPSEESNVKSVLLKLTMGKPVQVGVEEKL